MSHHLDTPLAAHTGQLTWCLKGRRARRQARAEPGCGQGASPTPSTLTCRCCRSSTRPWHRGPHRTCPGSGELFPDVLSYVIGTPASYSFAARNGRTLADNAPEAMLSLVTNMAVPSGLTPATARQQRASAFPYLTPA
jgi:hypothetical protein